MLFGGGNVIKMFNSIKTKLISTSILIILITTTIVSAISYKISADIIYNDTLLSNNNQLSLLDNMSSDQYMNIKEKLLLEINSNELTTYLKNINSSEITTKQIKAIEEIQKYLNIKLYNNYEFSSLAVVTKDYIIGSIFKKDSYYIKRKDDDIEKNLDLVYEKYLLDKFGYKNPKFMSSQIDDDIYLIGIVNYDHIFKDLKNNLLILDNDLNVRWKNFNETINMKPIKDQIVTQEGNRILNIKQGNYALSVIKTNDEYFCLFYDLKEMNHQLDKIIFIIFTIILLSLILFGSISVFLANNIVIKISDLKNLVKKINHFSDDIFRNFIDFKSKDLYIKRKILIFYNINLIPVIIIIVMNVVLFSTLIDQNLYHKIDNITEQITYNIENKFQQFEQKIKLYSIDENLQKTMIEIHKNQKMPIDIIKDIANSNMLVGDIYYFNLYSDRKELLYSTGNNIEEFLVLEKKDDTSTHTTIEKVGNKNIFIVSKPIKQLAKPGVANRNKLLGYLEVGLKINLDQLVNNLTVTEGLTMYLVDENNKIIIDHKGYRYNSDMINRIIALNNDTNILEDKEEIYINKYKFKYDNNTLVFVSNIQSKIKLEFMIIKYNVLLLFALILIILMLSKILTDRILKPIDNLRNEMNKLSYGQMIDLDYIKSDIELMELINSFKEMLKRLNEMSEGLKQKEVEFYQVEKKKDEVELALLQSQINPHFFYNTITSIVFLLKANNIEKGIEMLLLTGKYFRFGLYRGESTTSIQEELELVRSYIEIQKIRMQNLVGVVFEVPDHVMDYKVVRFIIQPLVENSIVHGRKVGQELNIKIRIQEENHYILITVSDNGKGIQCEKVKEISDVIRMGLSSEHTGLRNINDRIRLSFGDEYGVNEIKSEQNSTTIKLKLPIIKDR